MRPKNVGMVFLPRTPSPSPQGTFLLLTHLFFSPRLLSAFIGRSVRIRQCLRSFLSHLSFLLLPCAFFFGFVVVLVYKKKNKNRTLCVVVFGHPLLASSFLSPSYLIGISRLRRSSPRGPPLPSPPPRNQPPPQPILSRGVALRPAIDSDLAILSWANGRLRLQIKRSSRLLLGSAWAGRTGVGPLFGPRSSRRARDYILCPCTSDVDFFF